MNEEEFNIKWGKELLKSPLGRSFSFLIDCVQIRTINVSILSLALFLRGILFGHSIQQQNSEWNQDYSQYLFRDINSCCVVCDCDFLRSENYSITRKAFIGINQDTSVIVSIYLKGAFFLDITPHKRSRSCLRGVYPLSWS